MLLKFDVKLPAHIAEFIRLALAMAGHFFIEVPSKFQHDLKIDLLMT